MKKSKEYLEEEIDKLHDDYQPWYAEGVYEGQSEVIIKAIKKAQLEAIEETAKFICNAARVKFIDLNTLEEFDYSEVLYDDDISAYIDDASILNCIEILKKEIE